MTQISTAISDLVLSVSSFYGAGLVVRRYFLAAVGFIIIAIAAGIGFVRFLDIAPINRRHAVISLHSKLSWLSTVLGVPLIAASFCTKYGAILESQIHIASGILGIVLSVIFPNLRSACSHFVSTLAILSILLFNLHAENISGAVGAILYIISGTLIGTSGRLMGILCIDIFHYGLTVGNLAFYTAL